MRAAIAAALLACACGPEVNILADAQPGEPDARVVVDAPPVPDGPPLVDGTPPVYTIYVHSATTLYTMPSNTFVLTAVGPFDNGGDSITDLAVTPDGAVYGLSNTKLYEIDPATGKATYVANVPGVVNVGMTFLPGGTLLATDKEGGVREIDPATGAVTEVGSFGSPWATAGDLVAVADGTMYAISDKGPDSSAYDSNWLLTVNTSTGAAAPVGQIGYGQVFGVAYANGHVYAFTNGGDLIEIDRVTGAGTLVRNYPAVSFWGAGVTPLVQVD